MDREPHSLCSYLGGGMIGPARAMILGAPSGFDPSIYAGFAGDWLADDSVYDGSNNVTSVPSPYGGQGDLTADGTGVDFSATGWHDGSPCWDTANTTDGILRRTLSGGETDWTFFFVVDPTWPVPDDTVIQWLMIIGEMYGAGPLGGVVYKRSYDPDGALYQQDDGWVATFTAVAGPQVYCMQFRNADAPEANVWRNGVLVGSGDFTTDVIANQIVWGGGLSGGVPGGPGYQFFGKGKRITAYLGSALDEASRAAIEAELIALYV